MLTVSNRIVSGSTVLFQAAFFDPAGAPAAPLQVYVEVTDPGNNVDIRAKTAIPSADLSGSTATIRTLPSENTISPSNKTEKRRVIITATFGVGDDWIDTAEYTITRVGIEA